MVAAISAGSAQNAHRGPKTEPTGWIEAMSIVTTPRPHAEVIKAWADGAEVEFHNPQTFEPGRWVVCDFPTWRWDCLYRVKEVVE